MGVLVTAVTLPVAVMPSAELPLPLSFASMAFASSSVGILTVFSVLYLEAVKEPFSLSNVALIVQ